MAILDIRIFPDPVLRVDCPPVETFDDELRRLVDDMVETMYAAPGVGLAAPQIGVEKRLAVVDVTGAVYRELFESIVAAHDDPADAYRGFCVAAAEALAGSGYLDPCPDANRHAHPHASANHRRILHPCITCRGYIRFNDGAFSSSKL